MPREKSANGLDKQIQTALGAFFRDLPSPWFGKERDAVVGLAAWQAKRLPLYARVATTRLPSASP